MSFDVAAIVEVDAGKKVAILQERDAAGNLVGEEPVPFDNLQHEVEVGHWHRAA